MSSPAAVSLSTDNLVTLISHNVPVETLSSMFGDEGTIQAAKMYMEENPDSSISATIATDFLLKSKSGWEPSMISIITKSLLSDPDDPNLMDSLTETPLKDPVVLSTGYVVERSTAIDPATSAARMKQCPWTRSPLSATVYPIQILKEKIVNRNISRLETCIAVAEALVTLSESGTSDSISDDATEAIFDTAEEIITDLGDETYLHLAKRLAVLQRRYADIGDTKDPKKVMAIHRRLIKAAEKSSKAGLIRDAVMECMAEAEKCETKGQFDDMIQWLTFPDWPDDSSGESWKDLNLTTSKLRLKAYQMIQEARGEKEIPLDGQLNDVQLNLLQVYDLVKDDEDELAAFLLEQNLTTECIEELKLQSIQCAPFDASFWGPNQPYTQFIDPSIGLARVKSRDLYLRGDHSLNPSNPETCTAHIIEVAFKLVEPPRTPAYLNTVFSQCGEGSGWEIRVGAGNHVEFIWTTTHHNAILSKHNEFVNDNVTVEVGQWVHAVGVYSKILNELCLYVNGTVTTKMLRPNSIFKGCRGAWPCMGLNPVWTDRWIDGYVAFGNVTETLPVDVGAMDDYFFALANKRLSALEAY